MKKLTDEKTLKWLLDGDVSLQYQVNRDLLNKERNELRNRISKEGWGFKFLSKRNKNGHWGRSFYQPKWISTHYTLLDLKNLSISPNINEIKQTISIILRENKSEDGGILPIGSIKVSDVCINGMFLNYASYFKTDEEKLKSVVDFILSQQMKDGGFNCQLNRVGAVHSSLHTTLCVLEGILEYNRNGYKYRLKELEKAELESREFVLMHRLYKSDKTGEIIKEQFLKLPYPPRWYYDILRALDYFQFAKVKYDDRMQDAIDVILKKKKSNNTWLLQANHPGQTHFEMEKVGDPSRWNTLRALRILKYFEIKINPF